ncbi:MAG: hypothetical protein LUQ25_05270 [Methanoregulaceae archaeon]|nr:hypothetical protein [Methanoregulaceae archaeon]
MGGRDLQAVLIVSDARTWNPGCDRNVLPVILRWEMKRTIGTRITGELLERSASCRHVKGAIPYMKAG